MRCFFGLILMFVFSVGHANDLKVIEYSQETRQGEEYFFLYGTSKGNYIVKSWQFDIDDSWDGEGEPRLSIGQAIERTYEYFGKSKSELGIQEVMLRPAFSKQDSVIWFYHVTLITLPYEFGAEKHEVVVLTSGEVLLPYKPKS